MEPLKGRGVMIITTDQDHNFLVGDIILKDKDGLTEIRDFLLQDNKELENFKSTVIVLKEFQPFVPLSYPKKQVLIQQYVTPFSCLNGNYLKKFIYCANLNSILLFTSLIGELEKSNSQYSEYAKDFIWSGIIKNVPFSTIWEECSKNLITPCTPAQDRMRKQDLKVFRTALQLNLIQYQIDQIIEADKLEDYISKRYFLNQREAFYNEQQIAINNALLKKNKNLTRKK